MGDKVKILAFGDVNGNFDKLFNTVERLNERAGPFSAVLCSGRFFHPDGSANDELLPYLQGRLKVAVPTYFIVGGEDANPVDGLPADGGDLCKNLTFLGRAGCRRLPNGLKVAYLSGAYDSRRFDESGVFHRGGSSFKPFYLREDVQRVVDAASTGEEEELAGVDVLMTAEWGDKFDTLLPEDQPAPLADRAVNTLSPAVTTLASSVPARYHLAGTEGVHLQLPPYRNALHATRFYGLGAVDGGGGAGRKFVVALAVTPTIQLALAAARDGVKEGADATPCPYTSKPRPKPSAPTPEVVGPVARDDVDDEWARGDHKDLEGGEWRCGECGNVNRAHQRDRCNMKRCGAPREGLELWRLESMHGFNARGAKRTADGDIMSGFQAPKTYTMMTREEAEAEAARAAEAAREEAAREEAGSKKQKKGDSEKTSLYASQKPMSQKAKYRKGTRNPQAWR
mgnify:FL=1